MPAKFSVLNAFYCLVLRPVGNNKLFTQLKVCFQCDLSPSSYQKWIDYTCWQGSSFMSKFMLCFIKAQGTSDHAGIIFGHAGPFPGQDMPGFVREDPDLWNFDVKSLEFPIKF